MEMCCSRLYQFLCCKKYHPPRETKILELKERLSYTIENSYPQNAESKLKAVIDTKMIGEDEIFDEDCENKLIELKIISTSSRFDRKFPQKQPKESLLESPIPSAKKKLNFCSESKENSQSRIPFDENNQYQPQPQNELNSREETPVVISPFLPIEQPSLSQGQLLSKVESQSYVTVNSSGFFSCQSSVSGFAFKLNKVSLFKTVQAEEPYHKKTASMNQKASIPAFDRQKDRSNYQDDYDVDIEIVEQKSQNIWTKTQSQTGFLAQQSVTVEDYLHWKTSIPVFNQKILLLNQCLDSQITELRKKAFREYYLKYREENEENHDLYEEISEVQAITAFYRTALNLNGQKVFFLKLKFDTPYQKLSTFFNLFNQLELQKKLWGTEEFLQINKESIQNVMVLYQRNKHQTIKQNFEIYFLRQYENSNDNQALLQIDISLQQNNLLEREIRKNSKDKSASQRGEIFQSILIKRDASISPNPIVNFMLQISFQNNDIQKHQGLTFFKIFIKTIAEI